MEVEHTHEFPCGACGAKLVFEPGSDAMACPYCGHRQELAASKEEVLERCFEDALRNAKHGDARKLVEQGRELRCQGCGAVSIVSGQADRCDFCDSPVVVETADDQIIVPESVLPFKLGMKAAREAFQDWVKGLWFAPNDLAKRARHEGLSGVYLPYWTYDSQTETYYTGQRGDYYYVTETYTDSEGNTKTRQARRTRWSHASGYVSRHFDDVLICASTSLPPKLIRELEPWDLEELRPYDPGFLSGFSAERYRVDLDEGFEGAKERMDPSIRWTIRQDIGGDEQRISSMDVTYSDVTFKHFLLPLWISSFRYHDKVYRFIVNARSGEASGERPWSVPKIVAAVLTALAVLGVAFWLYQRNR